MLCVGKNISFCFGVFDKVVTKNLLFVENFHSILLAGIDLGTIRPNDIFFNKVYLTKGTLTKLHYRAEIFRSNLLLKHISFDLGIHLFKHIVILPYFNEFLLPFLFLDYSIRSILILVSVFPFFFSIINVVIWNLLSLLFCLLLFQSLYQYLFRCILLE